MAARNSIFALVLATASRYSRIYFVPKTSRKPGDIPPNGPQIVCDPITYTEIDLDSSVKEKNRSGYDF